MDTTDLTMHIIPPDFGTPMLIKFRKVLYLEKRPIGIKQDMNMDGPVTILPKLVTP